MAQFVPRPGSERRKILLIGDSITQYSFSPQHRGWGAGLADWYQRTADVVNRGYSGYNTRWVRQSLGHILPTARGEDYALVTVFLGANDAVDGGAGDGDAWVGQGQDQHVPVAEYAANVGAIVDAVRAACPAAAVLLITPPPVDQAQWPNRSIPLVRQYRNALLAVAAERGTLSLDLWSPSTRTALDTHGAVVTTGTIAPVALEDMHDGLHLGGTGNDKVLWGIQAVVRAHLPALVPEDVCGLPNLPLLHLPHWSDLVRKSGDETGAQLKTWTWP